MEKIERVSLFFRIIFQLAFIALPITLCVAWLRAPEPLQLLGGIIDMSIIPRAYIVMHLQGNFILHTLSIGEKFFGFLVSMIPGGVDLFVLYFLIKLFRLYEKGEIFSANDVYYIRNIGYALIIGQLLNPIYEVLMGLVLTWQNPPGHLFTLVKLDQTNFGILLMAILIVLVSWIMAEGCKLREEQQLTV
jgi:hypothetical protein